MGQVFKEIVCRIRKSGEDDNFSVSRINGVINLFQNVRLKKLQFCIVFGIGSVEFRGPVQ